jgi:hypothetical protein
MLLHFIGDYFHYDNKFWLTVRTLILRPGVITKDYIQGKRARYLNPIQLYIFVTTVFFLLFFFSASSIIKESASESDTQKPTTSAKTQLQKIQDTIRQNQQNTQVVSSGDSLLNFVITDTTYSQAGNRIAHYDSTQERLPPSKRDGYLRSYIKRKILQAREESHGNKNYGAELGNKIIHNAPKLFFLLLPFFALMLWLVNFRSKILYIDHLIFSLHFHSFWFISLLGYSFFELVFSMVRLDGFLLIPFLFGIGFYLYRSLRKVYPAGALKTVVKQTLLTLGYGVAFVILAIVMAIYSVLF